MNGRYLVALAVAASCLTARAETEIYIGLGESIIPVDGASATQAIAAGQFLESFSGKRFYFRVREGYESELVSLGTPRQMYSSGNTVEAVAEATVMGSDAAAASEPEQPEPEVLGPFEIAGIYIYDSETGIDRGVDCENATMTRRGPRDFEFICPRTMEI